MKKANNLVNLSLRGQILLLVLLALVLNFNTLFNGYALDDFAVITENPAVQKGISGIPEIIGTDIYSQLGQNKVFLSGGRYRPVPMILFALEYQFFGNNPLISHILNILLFALLIGLLFRLLDKWLFREQGGGLAFFTCLLFVVHPIHTEVIANIKSRDELLVCLFLLGSALALLQYGREKKSLPLGIGLGLYFLALLTRESALPFIIIVPLFAYFFLGCTPRKAVRSSLPLAAVAGLYLLLRLALLGFTHPGDSEILNAPYLLATPYQAFATKVFVLGKYLSLLFVPYPLSWDYGYNQTPYLDLGSVGFLFSLFILAGLLLFAFIKLAGRNIWSFSILYFFSALLLFSNFFVDIGAPLAERLLFQASLGFCIALSAGFLIVVRMYPFLAKGILLVTIVLFAWKTVDRNRAWKNNDTLNLCDVEAVPNSVRVNSGAAEAAIRRAEMQTDLEERKAWLSKAVAYAEKVVHLYTANPAAYRDLDYAYGSLMDCFDTPERFLEYFRPWHNTADTRWKSYLSSVMYRKGNGWMETPNPGEARRCFGWAANMDEGNVEAIYNIGGLDFLQGDTANGNRAWSIVRKLQPEHKFNKEEFNIH